MTFEVNATPLDIFVDCRIAFAVDANPHLVCTARVETPGEYGRIDGFAFERSLQICSLPSLGQPSRVMELSVGPRNQDLNTPELCCLSHKINR